MIFKPLHHQTRQKSPFSDSSCESRVKPGGRRVDADVARAIVEFVAGARGGSVERLAELDVEPALLSVVCRELNERRRAKGQEKITLDQVSGDRREILNDFYERSVADLPEAMRAFVEDKLLTKSGFRDNLALETALEEPGVTRELIDTLVSRRLLRIEDRIGTQRLELTHDVLAEVIRASRDTRQQRLAVEQLHERERVTRRRMWLARVIAAGLLVFGAGVSWIAWRAIRAEREQTRLRADADSARRRADALRIEAQAQELAAKRVAYASDMNALQRALDMDNLGRARELLNRNRPKPGEPDLRGWEWRYLWQFCQSDAQAILRPADDISIDSVSASADGKWVAVGSYTGGLLSVINVETKEAIRLPAGELVVRVAFSPREPLLAFSTIERNRRTGQSTGRVFLWNLNSRQVVRELGNTPADRSIMAFSADGQTVVVRSWRGNLGGDFTLWRVADGAKLASWEVGPGTSFYPRIAITRDASAAANISGSNQLGVIDLKTGRERWSAVATDNIVIALAFSPDGKILASGAGFADSTIRLWDAMTGRELGRLEGNRGWTSALVFLPDGKHLVSSSADQTIRLWNLATRTAVRTFRGHKTEVWSLALLPDQRTLASGSKDGSVVLWDLNAERGASSAGVIREEVGDFAFAGTGEAIVTIGTDGRVTRRRGRTFQEEEPLLALGSLLPATPTGTRFFRGIIHPSRPLLAAVTEAGKLQVWDWERRALVRELASDSDTGQIFPCRFFRDGTTLQATLARAGAATYFHREWDIATGRQTRSFDVPLPGSVLGRTNSTYSLDEKHLLMFPPGTPGDSVDINLETGRATSFNLDLMEANPGMFSPDARFLIVPTRRGYVRVFDAVSYREVATLGGYMFGLSSVTFSADGNRLATGGTASETMTLWDFPSRERLLTLGADASTLHRLTFSPDGNVLAGQDGAYYGSVYFWRAPSWAEIEKAEAAQP